MTGRFVRGIWIKTIKSSRFAVYHTFLLLAAYTSEIEADSTQLRIVKNKTFAFMFFIRIRNNPFLDSFNFMVIDT